MVSIVIRNAAALADFEILCLSDVARSSDRGAGALIQVEHVSQLPIWLLEIDQCLRPDSEANQSILSSCERGLLSVQIGTPSHFRHPLALHIMTRQGDVVACASMIS